MRLRVVVGAWEHRREWTACAAREFAGLWATPVMVDDDPPQPVRCVWRAMLSWACRVAGLPDEPDAFARRYRCDGEFEVVRRAAAACVGRSYLLTAPLPDEEARPGLYVAEDYGRRHDCEATLPYTATPYFRRAGTSRGGHAGLEETDAATRRLCGVSPGSA